MNDTSTQNTAKTTVLTSLQTWGESSVPPTALASLILAQSLRPPQFLPLLFPPVLLFTSYMNLSSYTTEAAGINAAWSGLYMLLARRRKAPNWSKKFGTRGIIRGTTMGFCGINLVAGGWVYLLGKREEKEEGVGT
ncbi:hypothetical protein ACLMJK_007162 [Lecanora helva]